MTGVSETKSALSLSVALATRSRTLISEADLKQAGGRWFYRAVLALLVLGGLTAVIPFVWGVLSALKAPSEIFTFPPQFFPKPASNPLEWGWGNYLDALQKIDFVKYFINTIVLAAGVWVMHLFPTALAGYAISKLDHPFKRAIATAFFATLMVPFTAVLIPLFMTVRDLPLLHLNLVDRAWGYFAVILPAGVNAFNIFVFKSFFDEIPNDLIDAARIDGAGEFRIFWSVAVPLSVSIIAVLSIFSFMATWNDFLWPYLVISDTNRYTVMLKLYYFQKQADIPANIVMAALILTTLPPIVVFLFFQKHILRGISLSGLKF
ncbi:MAG: carbohydrate ABC transporter permease [bacterium]